MAEGKEAGGDRLTISGTILGVIFSLTVICIGAVVRDKVAIAGLTERVDALRDRVAHLEAAARPWPQDRRGP